MHHHDVYYVEEQTIQHSSWSADNQEHANEQCLDAYPNANILVEVSAENFSEFVLGRTIVKCVYGDECVYLGDATTFFFSDSSVASINGSVDFGCSFYVSQTREIR